MDKTFWQTLMKNEYAIPDGHSLDELTAEIFSYLGNTDPELRDDIGYIVYANWLEKGKYTQAEIAEHIQTLLANLEIGIGETETDNVFLRSFSVLFLAEIIHNDNKAPKLNKAKIEEILEKGLWYLDAEKDPRGHIPIKGWAHALAHTADLLDVLADNRYTSAKDFIDILMAIANKLMASSDCYYVYGEDDRLSTVVLTILKRGLLEASAIEKWIKTLASPEIGYWKGAWRKTDTAHVFFNVQSFLRSLYLQVASEKKLPVHEKLEKMILEVVQNLKPY